MMELRKKICPICGHPTVSLRKIMETGEYFLYCKRYPKCDYVVRGQ